MRNSKSKILNPKQYQNSNNQNSKQYDLEERTLKFAKEARDFIKKLSRTITNIEYGKQLARSSGPVAANYIEANEALSKKDFTMRIKICRKEAKESRLWLRLSEPRSENQTIQQELAQEATEFLFRI